MLIDYIFETMLQIVILFNFVNGFMFKHRFIQELFPIAKMLRKQLDHMLNICKCLPTRTLTQIKYDIRFSTILILHMTI